MSGEVRLAAERTLPRSQMPLETEEGNARPGHGLREAPKLWQEHFAEVMTSKLGFRRCKSEPNLYCHESGRLYVLAYVDDLLVVGADEMRKSFMSQLSEEVLRKERLANWCRGLSTPSWKEATTQWRLD